MNYIKSALQSIGCCSSLVRLSKSRSLLISGFIVDPGVTDFYHLQRAKFTGGIFLLSG